MKQQLFLVILLVCLIGFSSASKVESGTLKVKVDNNTLTIIGDTDVYKFNNFSYALSANVINYTNSSVAVCSLTQQNPTLFVDFEYALPADVNFNCTQELLTCTDIKGKMDMSLSARPTQGKVDNITTELNTCNTNKAVSDNTITEKDKLITELQNYKTKYGNQNWLFAGIGALAGVLGVFLIQGRLGNKVKDFQQEEFSPSQSS